MIHLSKLSLWISNGVGLLGVLGILVMMLHIVADVVARLLLGSPLVGTNEIVSRYYMVAVAFLPIAWVEHRRAMITVELVDGMMGRKARFASDILVAITSLLALVLVVWTSLGEALDAFGKGAFVMAIGTRIPVWPTYFILPLGCGLAALLVLARTVEMILTGKTADLVSRRTE